MCDDVEQDGGGTVCDGGGIDTSSVVDVPKERIASPGDDRVTIVDGLSPVNGATMQSDPQLIERPEIAKNYPRTWGEIIPLYPPSPNGSEDSSAWDRFTCKLVLQVWTTTCGQQGPVPLQSLERHQIHSTGIGAFDGRNMT